MITEKIRKEIKKHEWNCMLDELRSGDRVVYDDIYYVITSVETERHYQLRTPIPMIVCRVDMEVENSRQAKTLNLMAGNPNKHFYAVKLGRRHIV